MNTINQALIARLKLNREALLDDAGRVRIDLACRSCGYNLRGIAGDGTCPECGQGVEDALQDDRPEHSNPAWLGRTALGGNLFGIAALLAVAIVLLLIFTAIIADITRHGQLIALLVVVLWALTFATVALTLTAVWLITSKDPTRHHIQRETVTRWTARLGLTSFGPLVILLLWLVGFVNLYGPWRGVLAIFFVALPLVTLAAGLIALMLYIQTLATRMTDWNLVQSITTVCYGLGVCTVLFLLSMVLAFPLGDPAWFCGCCTLVLAAALGLWMLLLIECARQDLNAARQRVKWSLEYQQGKAQPAPSTRPAQAKQAPTNEVSNENEDAEDDAPEPPRP
ncbi:hypothetical protein OT109_04960 [Phycisphaeraceae bacterium D3-23]